MPELSPGVLECLRFIHRHPDHSISNEALILQFGKDNAELYTDRLSELGFIDDDRPSSGSFEDFSRPFVYSVTPAGLEHLRALALVEEKVQQYRAEKERQKKADAVQRDRDKCQQFYRDLLIATISSIITLTVEHFFDIIAFIKEHIGK